MGKMTVYHGSYTAVKKPEILKGRNTKDFGPGFYCTLIREQAERWARRYDISIVNTYTVRLNTDSERWQMIRFIIILPTISTASLPESSSGPWPVLNIPPIRSTSAPRQLWPVWNTYQARR